METLIFLTSQSNFIQQIETAQEDKLRSHIVKKRARFVSDCYINPVTNFETKTCKTTKRDDNNLIDITRNINTPIDKPPTPFPNPITHLNNSIETPIGVSPEAPPFNLIYNFESNTCWVVSLIHNIRANPPLQKFLLDNCQDKDVKLGLTEVLEIDCCEISQRNLHALNHLSNPSTSQWGKGGNTRGLLRSLLANACSANDPNNTDKLFESYIFVGNLSYYTFKTVKNIETAPYIILDLSIDLPSDTCVSLSDALVTKYKSKSYVGDTIVLNYAPKFLVFDVCKCYNSQTRQFKVKGFTIEKNISIKVKGKESKQKYSLTGINISQKSKSITGHVRAVIKINNKWYDTDYETIKYLNATTQIGYNPSVRIFDEALNSARKWVFMIYDDSLPMYNSVHLLFYQLED